MERKIAFPSRNHPQNYDDGQESSLSFWEMKVAQVMTEVSAPEDWVLTPQT